MAGEDPSLRNNPWMSVKRRSLQCLPTESGSGVTRLRCGACLWPWFDADFWSLESSQCSRAFIHFIEALFAIGCPARGAAALNRRETCLLPVLPCPTVDRLGVSDEQGSSGFSREG